MNRYRRDIDQEAFERIENYLMDRMDASDRRIFEEEMVRDELLRNEVDLQRKLFAAVETGSFIPARQRTRPVFFSYRWLYAAAAILVVSLAAWWFLFNPRVTSGQLFAKYYRPDPGLPVVMSSTSQYVFYDGMVSYKKGDYARAIALWEQLAAKNGYSDTLRYYTGVAFMNANEPAKAIDRLLPLAQSSPGVWREEACWYLALCYLRTGNIPTAENWLKQLPSDERAKQLQADIRRMPSR